MIEGCLNVRPVLLMHIAGQVYTHIQHTHTHYIYIYMYTNHNHYHHSHCLSISPPRWLKLLKEHDVINLNVQNIY